MKQAPRKNPICVSRDQETNFMAFFKFRERGPQGIEGRNAAASPLSESVEAMRRRARHRLIGAAVLVLVGVIGFPLLFDTQPRPIGGDIPIEIPDRNKVKPMVVPHAATSQAAASGKPGALSLASKRGGDQGSDDGMITEAADGTEITSPRVAALTPAPAIPPAPKLEARPTPKPEAKPAPKSEAKPASKPEAKPVPKPEAKAEPKAEPKSGTKPESKTEAKLEPKPRQESKPKQESKAEAKPETPPAAAASKPVASKPATPKPAAPKPAAAAGDGDRALALLEGRTSAVATAAKPAGTAEGDNSRFIVQVGAYADADQVKEVRQKLEKAGLRTYTHVAKTSDGDRTRVRLGPFSSRAEAEKAAGKVKGLSLSASVLGL
jgi:DedD protein